MYIYIIAEAIVALIAGLLIAICTKKTQDVTCIRLDKVGRITNIFLILVYVPFSPVSGPGSVFLPQS